MVTRVAWFHCFAGLDGEKALGALVDAGADLGEVDELVRRLPLDGWRIEAEPVLRAGLGATRVTITTSDDSNVVRTYAHIQGLITEARLPDLARQRAENALLILAETEAALQRRSVQQVHFHEVGGVPAILQIVATCAAMEVLSIDDVAASPVAQGHGAIRPESLAALNPNPATLAMLAKRRAPVFGRDLPIELTNATGAAILAGIVSDFGSMPDMAPEAIGYGAGDRDLDGLPNVTQVVIGERTVTEAGTYELFLVESNLDDVTGEVLAHTIASLLAAGALEAWCTPILMQKGRPGHKISALCEPLLVDQISHVLLIESGSAGLRTTTVARRASTRRFDEVDVDGYPVRIKVGPGRAKAAFDDAARVARRTKLPVREVISRAEAAWHMQRHRDQSPVDTSPTDDNEPDPNSPTPA